MTDFAPHIKALLTEAEKMHEANIPPYNDAGSLQEAMLRIAYLDANRAYHENRGGDALKALGAFWNIYLGWMEIEPQYSQRAQEYLRQRSK